MKRAFLGAALAAALLAGAAPKAQAWSRVNFGVGLNTSLETSARYVTWLGYQRHSYPPPYAYANNTHGHAMPAAPVAPYGAYGGLGAAGAPAPPAGGPALGAAAPAARPAPVGVQPTSHYVGPAAPAAAAGTVYPSPYGLTWTGQGQPACPSYWYGN
jgi:hypothetical protein